MFFKRMVWLSLIMALGCKGDSSIQFPPVVTAYTVPVPVFGEAAAVEGVFTAARNTESGDLSSLYSESEPFYPPAEVSGSDGSSTFQIPTPEYGVPFTIGTETISPSIIQNSNVAIGSSPTVQENIGKLPTVGPIPSPAIATNTPLPSYNIPTPSSHVNLASSGGQGNTAVASSSSSQDLTSSSLVHTIPIYYPAVVTQSGNIGQPIEQENNGVSQSVANYSPPPSLPGQELISSPFAHTVPIYAPPVDVHSGNAEVNVAPSLTGQENTAVTPNVASSPSAVNNEVPIYAPPQELQNGNVAISPAGSSSFEQSSNFASTSSSLSGQEIIRPSSQHEVPIYPPLQEMQSGNVAISPAGSSSLEQSSNFASTSSSLSGQEIIRPSSQHEVPNYPPLQEVQSGNAAFGVVSTSLPGEENTGFAPFTDSSIPSYSSSGLAVSSYEIPIYAPSEEIQSGGYVFSTDSTQSTGQDTVQVTAPSAPSSSSSTQEINRPLFANIATNYASPIDLQSGNVATSSATSSTATTQEQIASYFSPVEAQSSSVASSSPSEQEHIEGLVLSPVPYVPPGETQYSNYVPNVSSSSVSSEQNGIAIFLSPSLPYAPPVEVQSGNVGSSVASSSLSPGHEQAAGLLSPSLSYELPIGVQSGSVASSIESFPSAHEQTGGITASVFPYAPPIEVQSGNVESIVGSSLSGNEQVGGILSTPVSCTPLQFGNVPSIDSNSFAHEQTSEFLAPPVLYAPPVNVQSNIAASGVANSAFSGHSQVGGFRPYVPPKEIQSGNALQVAGHRNSNKETRPASGIVSSLTSGTSIGHSNIVLPRPSYGVPVLV